MFPVTSAKGPDQWGVGFGLVGVKPLFELVEDDTQLALAGIQTLAPGQNGDRSALAVGRRSGPAEA